MRALLLAILLVAPLAGCANAPATPTPASVPVTSPAKPTTGAPAEGAPETPVFALNRTFNATSTPYAQDFQVPKAGWLCVDADIRPAPGNAGQAAITILDASMNPVTIVSTRDGVLHNETILANDAPSAWHVRIDLSGFTGEVGLNVSQMG